MLKSLSFNRVGAVVIALAVTLLTANSGTAQKVPLADVGLASIVGSQISGNVITYQFNLNATTNGTLLVKGTIKGKKLKGKFPDYVASLPAGISSVTGSGFTIPSSYTGSAVVSLKIFFNGKRVGAKVLLLNITTPPPASAYPVIRKTLYDVGFENLVTLDGTIVSTDGLGPAPTYAWTQTAGMPTALSSASAVSPTFSTGHLTNFVDMADHLAEGDLDGIGLDAEQVIESTYTFQLLISGNSQIHTGIYTVICSSPSPKQPNTPVGLLTYFKAGTNSTSWALLSKPPGSTAVLTHTNSLTPALRPDIEGVYVIKDNVSGATRTNTAASWTGVEFCGICHGPGNNLGNKDMVTPWSQTWHASFFTELINSTNRVKSSPVYYNDDYNESCIYCHTVGYNKTPSANNGGFDDVAAALGWTFPTSINSNNWNNVPLPLQGKANIQCENCHGPGSRHPGPTSVSLNVAVCAQCHQDGHYHTRVEQWEQSPHFRGFKEVSEEEGENSTCARCHSPNGYVDVSKRIAGGQDVVTASKTNNYAIGIGELICQGCHDPHHTFDNPDRHQLRIYDTTVAGAPAVAGSAVLTNKGASATCMYCHNSRRFPFQVTGSSQYYRSVRSGQISGPHESTATEIFNGITAGVVTYGNAMASGWHTTSGSCVGCHMYPNPAIGAPGHNQVGDHTFKMSYMNGTNEVENIAACNQCHEGFDPVDTFDFVSSRGEDWDGTNGVQGIQSETTGLLDEIRTLLNTTGVASVTNAQGEYTGFASPGAWSTNALRDAQYKAAWNWMMIARDRSKGVHNPAFTIRLLQNTYTDLSTNYYGDPNLTFTNVYPNAVLH
jgi:hypothetical protein